MTTFTPTTTPAVSRGVSSMASSASRSHTMVGVEVVTGAATFGEVVAAETMASVSNAA